MEELMRTGEQETRATWRRRAVWGAVVVAGMELALGVVPAGAAQTTPACLAKKLKVWGTLRKCQATENGKALQAKPADPAKCQSNFDAKLATLNDQAQAAAIACRYRPNGDGTVTDYDTGLQWEQKTGSVGSARLCQYPSCPAGDVFTGTFTAATCAPGTFTITVSGDGTTWTGTSVDSNPTCSGTSIGTISGSTLSGTGPAGSTISGTIDCSNAEASGSITASGFVIGSWSASTQYYCPDPHDVNNVYTWSATGVAPDGPAFTGFLAQLNNCMSANGRAITGGFAAHCDWRLPSIAELTGIYDTICSPEVCIDPTFGPTAVGLYWSATTAPSLPSQAWVLEDGADGGPEINGLKSGSSFFVRGVRSGL
jgi:hypothetical protein